MADSTLAVERRGDVVWCALDRPPLNLFEPGLIAALRATFEALARDAAIRAAVVTGRGRAFTAGMDVRVLHGLDAAALTAAVDETLAALLACAPGAVRAQKALMIRWRESDLPAAVRAGIDAFVACYAGDEPREGAAAFLEKRAPRFEGRAR